MDSPATSRTRFLTSDGEPIQQPREWAPALVQLDIDPDRWQEAVLSINHRPVEIYRRRLPHTPDAVVANWERSGAGHYVITMALGSSIERLHIRVEPEKISPDGFEHLLDDLNRQPAAIALALQNTGALEGVTFSTPKDPTLAAELSRLRRAVTGTPTRPGLVSVLSAIARQPHRTLLSNDHWVERHRLRRPNPTKLRHALTRPGNLDADLRPRRAFDTRVEHTLDVYENRLLLWFTTIAVRRLAALSRILRDTSRTALHEEVGGLTTRLSAARRNATYLDEVTLVGHLENRLTQVLLRIPAYRATYEGWLEFLQSGFVRLDDAAHSSYRSFEFDTHTSSEWVPPRT